MSLIIRKRSRIVAWTPRSNEYGEYLALFMWPLIEASQKKDFKCGSMYLHANVIRPREIFDGGTRRVDILLIAGLIVDYISLVILANPLQLCRTHAGEFDLHITAVSGVHGGSENITGFVGPASVCDEFGEQIRNDRVHVRHRQGL